MLISYESIMGITTLVMLEIVLGIDNIIFINLLVSKLPKPRQDFARKLGILLAMFSRLLLLSCIGFLLTLNKPLFSLLNHPFSFMQLLLIAGGGFLIFKSVHEIHTLVEKPKTNKLKPLNIHHQLRTVLTQIIVMDMVFSLDSIFTAFGLVTEISWMVIAIIIAVLVMLFLAAPIARFIEKNPSLKLLALGFLLMIGTLLVADGFGHYFERSYLYFAILFALLIEGLNIRRQQQQTID